MIKLLFLFIFLLTGIAGCFVAKRAIKSSREMPEDYDVPREFRNLKKAKS